MVWSHYKNESELSTASPHKEDEGDDLPENVDLTYEDWCTHYSDDLYNMWSSLKTYVHDAVVDEYLLCFSKYDDFCTFVYNHSKIRKKSFFKIFS